MVIYPHQDISHYCSTSCNENGPTINEQIDDVNHIAQNTYNFVNFIKKSLICYHFIARYLNQYLGKYLMFGPSNIPIKTSDLLSKKRTQKMGLLQLRQNINKNSLRFC